MSFNHSVSDQSVVIGASDSIGSGVFIFTPLAPHGAVNDFFGISVAISGESVVVGASFEGDNGAQHGNDSVYVFALAPGSSFVGCPPPPGDCLPFALSLVQTPSTV